MRAWVAAGVAALLVSGCDGSSEQASPTQSIEVRGEEQDRFHQLNDLNRSIALRRALRDSGYRCQRIERSGFVGKYRNLDMWTATCADGRDWAVFVGPDGSAQVRDCGDVERFGLPPCEIKSAEAGPGEVG